jgi:energy-coupling factor transport system ATP-binding protein
LALACVLVTSPDLLVLDEPTRGVDPERKRELAALLRRGREKRATLVVTHDHEFAAAVADRTVALGREPVLA